MPADAPENLVERPEEVKKNLSKARIQLKMNLKTELPETELLEPAQVMAALMVPLVGLRQAIILVEEEAWGALFQEKVEKTSCEQVEQLSSVAREVMHCHHKAVA